MEEIKHLTAFTASLVDELVQAGVTDAVISPGSRSTPIAYLLAEHPGMKTWLNIDERSAAFFALGMAKEQQKPVVLLCTSGTAAANYFPAIVEARISRVPLIVLTADRPHELRDVGAPQAIEQINLYGNHAKWFVEMPLPDAAEDLLRFVRTTICRAVATSIQRPAGVVHINLPLREPLIPDFELAKTFHTARKQVAVTQGQWTIAEQQSNAISMKIQQAERPLIICGTITKLDFATNVLAFSNKIGAPIVADPLSGLRANGLANNSVIDCYDTFLRFAEVVEQLRPDLIIRFGAMPVSKALTNFIKSSGAYQIVVNGDGGWSEPTGTADEMIYCDEVSFCEQLTERITKGTASYCDQWQTFNYVTKQGLGTVANSTEFQEGKLFANLSKLIPDNCNLFVGNSMAIRDLDTFFHQTDKDIHFYCNRGANGIDGVVSTALGVSASSNKPSYLVIGDLSFIHDLNSLVIAKMNQLDLFIIVNNNDGGAIFSFLPQAKVERQFDLLFGTPHGLTFSGVVDMVGGQYRKAESWSEVEAGFKAFDKMSGLRVLEIISDRQKNVEQHQDLLKKISQAIK